MSFLDRLKETFTYRLDTDDGEKDDKEPKPNKPRLNIGDPLQRLKDVKDVSTKFIKDHTSIEQKSVTSDYTKKLVYTSIYNNVEKKLKRGKPVEEARILFRRFLEEKVTDEARYSDLDLEYIKEVVSYCKALKRITPKDSTSKENVVNSIITSPYFLNIVEILDTHFGYHMMADFCEKSYIVCGYSYCSNNGIDVLSKLPNPTFKIEINDSFFVLLKEVQGLISNESSVEEKTKYVSDKVNPFFNRYVISNDIPLSRLMMLVELFESLSIVVDTEVSTRTEQSKDIAEDVLNQFRAPSIPVVEKQETFDPIGSLNKESKFINLYKPLVSEVDILPEELESAIKDIESLVFIDDYEMNSEETKIYQSLKARLKFMSNRLDGEVPENV